MKNNLILLFLLAVMISNSVMAQKDSIYYKDKGFDFIISGGMFFGSKNNAQYYNGNDQNELNLQYVFKNKYWYDEINQKIKDAYPFVSDSVSLTDEDREARYKLAMSVSLGMHYHFNKNWYLNLQYTFSRLTVNTTFHLDYPHPSGNQRDEFISETMQGKENRSMIDLSVGYLFHPSTIFKPFLEMGVQFNYIRVKSFDAYIENSPYSMMDIYNSVGYVPGAQINTIDAIYGGAGYGFAFAAGLKIAFNKNFSIDPLFYLSASSVHLAGYKSIGLNYGVQIRIVMKDGVFSRN